MRINAFILAAIIAALFAGVAFWIDGGVQALQIDASLFADEWVSKCKREELSHSASLSGFVAIIAFGSFLAGWWLCEDDGR